MIVKRSKTLIYKPATMLLAATTLLLLLGVAEKSREFAYVSFGDYDGVSGVNKAPYFWNGVKLGEGDEGFRELVRHLNGIAAGSVVKVNWEVDSTGGKPRFVPPHEMKRGALDSLAKKLGVIIVEEEKELGHKQRLAPADCVHLEPGLWTSVREGEVRPYKGDPEPRRGSEKPTPNR